MQADTEVCQEAHIEHATVMGNGLERRHLALKLVSIKNEILELKVNVCATITVTTETA